MAIEHAAGKKKGQVTLYALSTCVWCKKTRALLDSLGIEYNYEYVDLLNDNDRKKTLDILRKWNPASTYPTIVIDNKKCIIGFREDELREALKT